MSGRFSVIVRRNDDHYCQAVFGGYPTREAAELIAEAKRREIENRGWAMYVTIDEAHLVVPDDRV